MDQVQSFCAAEQKTTMQDKTLNHCKDILLTCPCGRVVKFPAGCDLEKEIIEHEKANLLD